MGAHLEATFCHLLSRDDGPNVGPLLPILKLRAEKSIQHSTNQRWLDRALPNRIEPLPIILINFDCCRKGCVNETLDDGELDDSLQRRRVRCSTWLNP